MSQYAESIEKLIDKLIKLPGIGRRSAERIVDHILGASQEDAKALAEAICRARDGIQFCRICNNLDDREHCRICSNERRNKEIVCVVENPSDVVAIEKSGNFNGVYHVLQGVISPLEGKGPGDLKIDGLIQRLKQNNIKEIIVATDADTEGETTAFYLAKLIKPFPVKLTRIGVGIPMGSNLDYADATTLSKALESRREL